VLGIMIDLANFVVGALVQDFCIEAVGLRRR